MTDTFDPHDPLDPFPPESFDPLEDFGESAESAPIPELDNSGMPPAAPRSPLLTGLIVLLVLVVASITTFQFLRDDGSASTGTPATTAETPADSPTAIPSTTQAAQATTTSTPSTTTSDSSTFNAYVAQGEPIPLSELKLTVDGIGSILLGGDADDAAGQLIASLGDPDEDSGPVTASGTYGSCIGDTERIIRFGAFVAVIAVSPNGTEIFAGYRLDLNYGGLQSETVNIETLSGLQVGNSVAQLQIIYERFDVRMLADHELGNIFELRNSTGELLLWGPVSEINGFVRGIYSPDACGRFD